MKKTCSRCGESKLTSQFGAKKSSKDGLDYWCKLCKGGDKIRYSISKGIKVNEKRFNSVVNGLNSTARKVFDVVPIQTYWGSTRIHQELFRTGINIPKSAVDGSLKLLIGYGIVVEDQPGLFSRTKIAKQELKASSSAVLESKQKTIQQEEKAMSQANQNPFDAVREVAIKFMDVAKQINYLATEIDVKLSDVERHIAANDQDTAKLKQLQSLLKSLG